MKIKHRDPKFTGTVRLGGQSIVFKNGSATVDDAPVAKLRRAGHTVEAQAESKSAAKDKADGQDG